MILLNQQEEKKKKKKREDKRNCFTMTPLELNLFKLLFVEFTILVKKKNALKIRTINFLGGCSAINGKSRQSVVGFGPKKQRNRNCLSYNGTPNKAPQNESQSQVKNYFFFFLYEQNVLKKSFNHVQVNRNR